jgi:hypothetical protein
MALLRQVPTRSSLRLAQAALALAGCSLLGCLDGKEPSKYGDPPSDEVKHQGPATKLSPLKLSAVHEAELAVLDAELATHATLTAEQLLAKGQLSYADTLGYDPQSAHNLDLIQASPLALDERELAKLAAQGFVITPRRAFPNMAYGYRTIYSFDLPVYVSLDAILETVHLSYDAILKALEESALRQELATLLGGARERLSSGAVADPEVAADLDLYFAVALALLEGKSVTPVAGADRDKLDQLVTMATNAKGIRGVSLFGTTRDVDFSQMKPRGHYEDSEALQRYFRATMWLGRTDFRLIETLDDGSQVFRRRQLDAVLALRTVIDGPARAAFDRLDATIAAFVGEHDYMELREVDALLADVGGDAAAKSDQELAQLIVERGYGAQRIASQVIFKQPGAPQLPLDRSFALLGQRYTADAHVFSAVVYDRVVHKGFDPRYLPNPLDAAYAAMGNDAALPLLAGELTKYGHAPELASIRALIDKHGDGYWSANLYTLWSSALRAMSPSGSPRDASGMPEFARTEPWQRRVLNTQLASWAELRHDTILYAKQSYTTGDACEFPDGYVDPYPAAFERLRLYALKGQEVTALLPAGEFVERVRTYFAELATVSATLRDMAEHERTGTPFTAEQMAFLNDAVTSETTGCAGPNVYKGWYGRLLFDRSDEEMDPTIADVHTDPGGNRPAKVLHVGTGLPRLMVVTANSCDGPRAYAGVASAYHEVVTGLDRLTDSEWAEQVRGPKKPADVPWMVPILP